MSQSRPAVPDPTEIAGRYEVLHKVGAGAFGTVYKAKDRILGRMVAIKTIRLEGLAASTNSIDDLLKRFAQEARTAARLKHPNIVTIYDIGEAEGLSYLAMEFIDGVGLDKVIAQAGRLPVERAASIAAQVADALDFAHKASVVHRDIKPANIMLETGDRVKVTDFGIAKPTDSAEHLTVTGSLLGTPSYMSPEQAKGAQLDGRSDLFAVGCVLYEMLAGKKAFRGETITALIFKIITEEPPPLRELAADVPESLVRIVNKALAKNADARYQTGQEMAEHLQALTRPGSQPTLRQSELETAAILPPTPSSPTLGGASPTLGTPATQSKPRTLVSPPAPPKPAPPAVRPAPPAAPAPRRSGGGAGLVLALGAVGVFIAAIAAFAGWFFLLRRSTPEVATLPSPEATAAVTVEPTTPPSVAALPTPLATAPPASATPPSAAPLPPPAPERRVASAPAPSVAPPAELPRTSSAPSMLDEEPEPQIDGRQAGEDLASKYRSGQGGGGGSFGTGARFRQRPRSPHNLAPLERPAVATLRHVLNAEENFSRKNGRYGTLAEMAGAQTLFLDLTPRGSSFQRAGYRFELALTGDGFRVTATPMAPGPRPFWGDETGYIRGGVD